MASFANLLHKQQILKEKQLALGQEEKDIQKKLDSIIKITSNLKYTEDAAREKNNVQKCVTEDIEMLDKTSTVNINAHSSNLMCDNDVQCQKMIVIHDEQKRSMDTKQSITTLKGKETLIESNISHKERTIVSTAKESSEKYVFHRRQEHHLPWRVKTDVDEDIEMKLSAKDSLIYPKDSIICSSIREEDRTDIKPFRLKTKVLRVRAIPSNSTYISPERKSDNEDSINNKRTNAKLSSKRTSLRNDWKTRLMPLQESTEESLMQVRGENKTTKPNDEISKHSVTPSLAFSQTTEDCQRMDSTDSEPIAYNNYIDKNSAMPIVDNIGRSSLGNIKGSVNVNVEKCLDSVDLESKYPYANHLNLCKKLPTLLNECKDNKNECQSLNFEKNQLSANSSVPLTVSKSSNFSDEILSGDNDLPIRLDDSLVLLSENDANFLLNDLQVTISNDEISLLPDNFRVLPIIDSQDRPNNAVLQKDTTDNSSLPIRYIDERVSSLPVIEEETMTFILSDSNILPFSLEEIPPSGLGLDDLGTSND